MHYPANTQGSQSSGKTSTRRVRALASYFTAALTAPVLGSYTRLFKDVFNRANTELMDVFGMQMMELPKAERVTIRQKRGTSFTCAL
jgi:hypothetical protein